MKTRPNRSICGFCSTGAHELCPGGVLNGNGEEVITCPCSCELAGLPRCLDCNRRGEDVNPEAWRCSDPDDCRAFIERRLADDPVIQQIRKIRADLAGSNQPSDRPRAPRAPSSRPTRGQCLHCGEATKGGLFLPGHDSAHVSAAVTAIRSGSTTVDEVITLWAGQGISDALQGKLKKRVVA